jgi:hypothetical protein
MTFLQPCLSLAVLAGEGLPFLFSPHRRLPVFIIPYSLYTSLFLDVLLRIHCNNADYTYTCLNHTHCICTYCNLPLILSLIGATVPSVSVLILTILTVLVLTVTKYKVPASPESSVLYLYSRFLTYWTLWLPMLASTLLPESPPTLPVATVQYLLSPSSLYLYSLIPYSEYQLWPHSHMLSTALQAYGTSCPQAPVGWRGEQLPPILYTRNRRIISYGGEH